MCSVKYRIAGFVGYLLVPLHNLTNNAYHFREGETFIWAEFTKTSPNVRWTEEANDIREKYRLTGVYEPFPDSKKNLDAWAYLNEAHKGPVRSSIPATLEAAEKSAKRAQTYTTVFTVGTLIGWAAILLTAIYGTAHLLSQMEGMIQTTEQRFADTKAELREFTGRAEERFKRISDDSGRLRQELIRLNDEVRLLRDEAKLLDSESPKQQ